VPLTAYALTVALAVLLPASAETSKAKIFRGSAGHDKTAASVEYPGLPHFRSSANKELMCSEMLQIGRESTIWRWFYLSFGYRAITTFALSTL
jgi:hypothetical protein